MMQILKPASSADNRYPRPERRYPHLQEHWISIGLTCFTRALCAALILFIWTLATKSSALDRDSHTLLLLHCDEPENQGAGKAPRTSGIRGSAGSFGSTGEMYLSAASHINPANGSLEFWIQPLWNGDDGKSHIVLRWGAAGGMLFGKDAGNVWRGIFNRFGAAGLPERGVGVNIASEWKSNQWHYVAFTWSEQSLRLFIDGQPRAQSASTNLPRI